MITTSTLDSPTIIAEILDHIHERTFGRLHDLTVTRLSEDRLHVSAIAHSRFVGQLGEWAVLEWVDPSHIDIAISVRLTSHHSIEVQK